MKKRNSIIVSIFITTVSRIVNFVAIAVNFVAIEILSLKRIRIWDSYFLFLNSTDTNVMKLKDFYNKIKDIGVDDNLTKLETKRVRLLNIFCFNWFIIELVFMAKDGFLIENPTSQILTHFSVFLGLIITFFFQFKKMYKTAVFLFFFFLIYGIIMFTNVIEKGIYLEYMYIIIPVFLLLFTNNNYVLYGTFIISYLLFVIPVKLSSYYPEGAFGSPVLILLQFFAFFFLVQYFKKENIANEAKLEKQRKELENLNNFQSQFFINVSHEIRTPITLMKGEIDKLHQFKNTVLEKESSNIEQGLNKQINKLKKIVNDVLDLAKMKEPNFTLEIEKVSLNALVRKLYLSFEAAFQQRKILFKTTIPKDTFWVEIDTVFFERALNNIIINAIKYTPKKGAISISLQQERNHVLLAISDTGIGISKEDIDLICNRFYQVNNSINKAGGSGIGLAFSKEIINLHKGILKIDSQLNVGSTFTIKLPLAIESSRNSVKEPTHLINTPLQVEIPFINERLHLLIVDDNYEMRVYLKSILKDYHCLEAENGQEALEILEVRKIDFILTDNMMPIMDGVELIKKVKENNIDTPILMLTAKTESKSKLEVLRLGIDDFLNKPFEREELIIRIKNALRNYKKRTEYLEKETLIDRQIVKSDWIKGVEEFIKNESSNSKLVSEDIAAFLNVSRSTLHRRIKSETGLTPNNLIKEIRLKKAFRIIELNPNVLLKTVALEVGYLHTSHFSTIYKKRFGKRPLREKN
ncbi:response regulator [Polaribacter litorisediminis]|uniref:ATP-binding response regulator n=1 Tax=Polaribacter litorisediminis TaxID=1908341 RepID=UPI001CC12847|nr:response regulator [Polaribacter litorisediminis]UAM99806.1 response regulator [Polaribacter litorisediminis]